MALWWQVGIISSFCGLRAKGPQAMCNDGFFHGFSVVKSWFLRKILLLGGPRLNKI
jgi:hypothetical protein